MTYGITLAARMGRWLAGCKAPAFACCLLAMASVGLAAEPAVKSFDIPAGSAERTLREFSAQSGIQALFPTDTVQGVSTAAVKGEMTAKQALDRMLAGTPLVGVQDESTGSLTIVREDSAEKAAKNVNRAIAETGKSGRPEKKSDLTENENGEKVIKLDTFEVFGQKTLNMDIRRTHDDIQPYVIFDREQIERSAAPDLEEFLKSNLPMNTANRSLLQNARNPGLASGLINLRGLGAGQTLILVDGRRQPETAVNTSEFQQPSLTGIPLASIERIEVLPASASSIYGGSATGGVINVIRKRDYSGFEVQLSYGDTEDHLMDSKSINVSGGLSLWNGRTHVTFYAAHSDAGSLLQSDRDFTKKARALYLANNPNVLQGIYVPPVGGLPNVMAANALYDPSGLTLVLDSGTSLGSSSTSLPPGYAGPSSDGGAALAKNAGKYNLDVPQYGAYLLRAPRNDSATLTVRQDAGKYAEFYFDISGSRSISDQSANASYPRTAYFAANDPANPFQQGIQVSYQTPQLAFPAESRSQTNSVTVGAIVRLPFEWSAVAEYGWSRTRFSWTEVYSSLTPTGEMLLDAAALQDQVAHPVALGTNLTLVPTVVGGPYDTVLRTGTIRASGPLFSVPAGPINLSTAIERRKQEAKTAFYDDFSGPYTLKYPARFQDVDSLYAESKIPLLGKQQAIPMVDELELQAAVRHDSYKTTSSSNVGFGASRSDTFSAPSFFTSRVGSTDYLLGLRYQLPSSLAFRSSFGTGFLAPGPNVITPTYRTETRSGVNINPPDPRRGNTPVSTPRTEISGGNFNLKPETSKNLGVGVIVSPASIKGLRLSLDYTRIKKANEIYNPDKRTVLQNETLFPGRVIRGAKLATDPADWAGPVTSLDYSPINLTFTDVAAIDMQADYSWTLQTGDRLQVAVTATQMRKFVRQYVPGTSPTDLVGFSDGPLKNRGNGTFSWSRGNWGAQWSIQYYDRYLVARGKPNSVAYNVAQTQSQGSAYIPSQSYSDIFVRYSFDGRHHKLFADTTISLGIQNVFNREPPILAAQSLDDLDVFSYSSYGDPRLRRFVLSVRRSFGK